MDIESPEAIWDGIETCPVHAVQWDEDCSGCEAEATARGAVIEQMQAEAAQRVKGLARAGVPFSQMAIDMIKVQIIWENIFTGRQAYLAEGEMGRRALQMMKAIQSDVSRRELAPEQRLTVVKNHHGHGRPRG